MAGRVKVCAECGGAIVRVRFAATSMGKVARVCSLECAYRLETKVPELAADREALRLQECASEREQMAAVWGEVA